LLGFCLDGSLAVNIRISTKPGLIYSIIVRLFVGLPVFSFIKMFGPRVNLSVGVPLVRVGMIVLGSLFGILLLKEGVNLRYLIGLAYRYWSLSGNDG